MPKVLMTPEEQRQMLMTPEEQHRLQQLVDYVIACDNALYEKMAKWHPMNQEEFAEVLKRIERTTTEKELGEIMHESPDWYLQGEEMQTLFSRKIDARRIYLKDQRFLKEQKVEAWPMYGYALHANAPHVNDPKFHVEPISSALECSPKL